MEGQNKNGKVPLISKIAYGFGDVGCNFSWMFVSNFLMIFYTDVFGISMAAVSALMLFSRFWDAINDPIVGGLTDKTNTKWGRYRPWLLIAAPITAILLMLTFWAHPDWSDTAKVLYMVITYCLLVLGYTCVNIPYGTLCGAMTQDIDERAKINTSRSVAAMIAIGIINIITVPLIAKLGKHSTANGYLFVAVIYGCIFAACHFFCFAKTREAVTTPEKEKISVKVQLKAVMQNRPYILALIGQVLFGFTLYGRNADVLYYFTYVEGNAAYCTTGRSLHLRRWSPSERHRLLLRLRSPHLSEAHHEHRWMLLPLKLLYILIQNHIFFLLHPALSVLHARFPVRYRRLE